MSFSKTTFIRFVLVFALALLSLNAHSIYKWKDAKGNVQYTEYPPPTGEVEIIKPPSISTIRAQKPKQTANGDEKNKSETKAGEQKSPPPNPRAEQARKEKNCDIARKNLAMYMRTKKIRDKEGKVTRLNDDDWQHRVDETKKKIEEFCN